MRNITIIIQICFQLQRFKKDSDNTILLFLSDNKCVIIPIAIKRGLNSPFIIFFVMLPVILASLKNKKAFYRVIHLIYQTNICFIRVLFFCSCLIRQQSSNSFWLNSFFNISNVSNESLLFPVAILFYSLYKKSLRLVYMRSFLFIALRFSSCREDES